MQHPMDRLLNINSSFCPMAIVLFALGGCAAPGMATALTGEPLFVERYTDTFEEETWDRLKRNLVAAQRVVSENPHAVESYVWLGRRLAYLGRYDEAVATFSEGLLEFPDNPVLLRHRGHRYLTLRKLQRAESDLTRARALTLGQPDIVEKDGAPNPAGIPTSTLQGNITYHLGLARFLQGDFESAEEAYRDCYSLSGWNDDMLCATTNWLYITFRRLGKDEEAMAILDPITDDMNILENHAYHQLLLLYKGERNIEEVLQPSAGADAIANPTMTFGVAHHLLSEGQADKALALFEAIHAGPGWPAFGHLAAEAELARLKASPLQSL